MSAPSVARAVGAARRRQRASGAGRAAPEHDRRQVVLARVARPAPRRCLAGEQAVVRAQLLRQLERAQDAVARRAVGRRCSAGVSTYTACQRTLSCRPGARRCAPSARRPRSGRRRPAARPRVFQTGCPTPRCAVAPARRPRHARRCGAARSRAARSGCPCGRSSAPRARPAAAGRPCRPSGARSSSSGGRSTSTTSSASSKHGVGHGLVHADAGDAADDVVQALQMLHVERRPHVDAGRPAAPRRPASASRGASPATLECASSSTRSSAGLRASAASRSNSGSARPR